MPDKEKEQDKRENQHENEIPEIELVEFQQYVQGDIPYNGQVKDLGKIEYDANAYIVLWESEAEEPTKKDFDWLNFSLNFGSTVFGGFSTLYDYKSFKQWNLGGWTDAEKTYRSASELQKNINTGKYLRGVEGIRNSNLIAQSKAMRISKIALKTQRISNGASGISIALSFRDMIDSRIEGDDKKSRGAFYDICFGCLTFVSGVGFVISGVYFITDVIVEKTTGKRLHEHWETWIGDRIYLIQRGIEAAFYRILNSAMPY